MSARSKRVSPKQRRSLADARNAKMQRRLGRGFFCLFFVMFLIMGIAIGIYQRNNGGKSFAVEHPAAFVFISVICGVLIGFYLYMDIRKNRPRRNNEEDAADQGNRISRKARRNAARKASIQKAQETESPRLYPLINTKSETNNDSSPACEHRSAHA